MRWILDDGPFGTLADIAETEDLLRYPAGRLVVAPSTARAAADSEPRVRLLELENSERERSFEIFEILLDGTNPAGRIFQELHREEATTLNRAEREAIAWAMAHTDDGVFVTEDKRAALTALAELGRMRVAHPFDLWIELLKAGAVAQAAYKTLCDRTRRKDQGLPRMPERTEQRLGPI